MEQQNPSGSLGRRTSSSTGAGNVSNSQDALEEGASTTESEIEEKSNQAEQNPEESDAGLRGFYDPDEHGFRRIVRNFAPSYVKPP
jgi:hypothetical protein